VSWARKIIAHAPERSIAALLGELAAGTWKEGDGAAIMSLPQARRRSVCGRVFKRGDLVWTCRTCAKDQTCVQCNECYSNSNHEGHEVFFHRSHGGASGCCDCGDPEAWHVAGNCPAHGDCSKRARVGEDNDDTVEQSVPVEVQRGLRLVTQAAVAFLASWTTSCVRGYQHLRQSDDFTKANPYVSPDMGDDADELCLYLHNDDVHTYDDVTTALDAIGVDAMLGAALTQKVDQVGQACVLKKRIRSLSDFDAMKLSMSLLEDADLACSVGPTALFDQEGRVAAVMEWLTALGRAHEGLQRIVTQVLVEPVSNLPQDLVCLEGVVGVVSAGQLFALNGIEGAGGIPEFPSFVQHTSERNREVARACLESGFDERDGLVEPQRIFCPLFKTPGLQVPLAVLILASPLLFKSFRLQLNAMVVIYQQDSVFKACFSQLFTCLYPALHNIKMRGLGAGAEDIFSCSVQIYTANGIVTLMSTDGVERRLLSEEASLPDRPPISITKMLVNTARNALSTLGCSPGQSQLRFVPQSQESFLDHSHLMNRRLSPLFKDLEYVTENSLGNIRVLKGERDAGTFESWLQLCHTLQGLDSIRRRTDVHVEMEDQRWASAANLVLELESASLNFVVNALFPSREIIESEKQVSSVGSQELVIAALVEQQQQALEICFRKALTTLSSWAVLAQGFESESGHFFHASPEEPFPLLGHSVAFPATYLRAYTVSYLPVSLNQPLLRLLSKMLYAASCKGLQLDACLAALRSDGVASIALVDYSLRCLAFVCQTSTGLWVRNGLAPLNLAYNYGRPPLCRTLRDADLVALQAGLLSLGPDTFLAAAVDRFEMSTLYGSQDGWIDSLTNNFEPQVVLYFIAELLRLLALTVTNLPTVLDDQAMQLALTVAVVNHVLAGHTSIGALSSIKLLLGNSKANKESDVLRIVSLHTTRREATDGSGAAVLEIHPGSAVTFFDPLYWHLPEKRLTNAADEIRARIKRQPPFAPSVRGANRWRPIVSTEVVLFPPHPSFAAARGLLFRPLFTAMLLRSLAICNEAVSRGVASGKVNLCLERIVYLVTLRVHLREAGAVSFAASSPSGSDLQASAEADETQIFSSLCDWSSRGVFDDDALYLSGLRWLLCKLGGPQGAGLHARGLGEIYGEELVAGGGGGSGGGDAASSAKRMAAAAQARAKALMAQQSAAFMSNAFGEDDSDSDSEALGEDKTKDKAMEEDDDGGTIGEASVPESYETGAPECILCHQQHTGSPVGYLALASPCNTASAALKAGLAKDNPDLSLVYSVVAPEGASIRDDKGHVILHLHQGSHVLAAPPPNNRYDNLLAIEAPARGYIPIFQLNEKPQRPRGQNVTVNLTPLSRFMWGQHGEGRSLLTHCGHAMHYDCFNTYRASFRANMASSVMHHACSYDRGEVLCPLCKGICNALVPHTPHWLAKDLWATPSSPSSSSSSSSSSEESLPLFSAEFAQNSLNKRWMDGGFEGCPYEHNSSFNSEIKNRVSELLRLAPAPNEEWVEQHGDALGKGLALLQVLVDQARLPWVPDQHTRSAIDAAEPAVHAARLFHAAWAAVGYFVSTQANTRRWVGWDPKEKQEWVPDSPSSSMGAQLVLLLRSMQHTPVLREHVSQTVMPQLRQLLYGADVTQGTWATLDHLTDLPPARVPSGQCSVCFENFGSIGSEREPRKCCDICKVLICLRCLQARLPVNSFCPSCETLFQPGSTDVGPFETACTFAVPQGQSLSPSDSLRVLYGTPFASLPSSCTPSPRKLASLLLMCRDGGVHGEELWAALCVPLLAQDLCAIAALVAAVAPSLEALGELLRLLLWARVCQVLVEARPSRPLSDSEAESAENVEEKDAMEEALLSLQAVLGVTAPPSAASETGTALSKKRPLLALVRDGLHPFAEFLALLARAATQSSSSPSSSSVEAPAPGPGPEPLNTVLGRLKCPSLHSLLCSEAAPTLEAVAALWAKQCWKRIDRTSGRFASAQVPSAWMPSRSQGGEAFTPAQLSALPLARARGSWSLIGVDPEPPFELELTNSTLVTPTTTALLASITGLSVVVGVNGAPLRWTWPDLSHLGLCGRHQPRFAPLPHSYNELYSRAKFPYGEISAAARGAAGGGASSSAAAAAAEGTEAGVVTVDEPAVCLICGQVVQACNRLLESAPSVTNPGECTRHARSCGLGMGVFFLPQRHTCLLVRNDKSCIWPSIYLDSNGETGSDGSCRPLFLSEGRLRRLEELWIRGEVGREVARARVSQEMVIRLNVY